MKRYQWAILQAGSLSLQPDGTRDRSAAHACTVTLVWPEGESIQPLNSLLIDPCFSERGYQAAVARLAALGASPSAVGAYFVTHDHQDHVLQLPPGAPQLAWQAVRPGAAGRLPGLHFEHSPGHHSGLHTPNFLSRAGRVWVASDAILNRAWLRAWQYYWPNNYSHRQVIQTWRSLAASLAQADWIIPGHGPEFAVEAALLTELIAAFPRAAYAAECPDVAATLRQRLASLQAGAKE